MQEMLKITGIRKSFSTLDVLKGVDLTVHKGEVVSLIGPSGSGKTTLLRCANFLDQAEDGTMVLDGQTYHLGHVRRTEMYEARRHTAFVFQNYNLFLNKTALQNVTEGLIVARKMPRDEAEARAQKALEKVGLGNRGASYPNQLSGGQQQRVAVARALVMDPEVLLLDEPLSNLDAKLRESVRVELREIQQRMGLSTIYVTHDQSEALSMSDKIVVLKDGIIHQVGTAQEIYFEPKTPFVADFIGTTNLLKLTGSGDGEVRYGNIRIPVSRSVSAGVVYHASIRPECIKLAEKPVEGMVNVPSHIENRMFLGEKVRYFVRDNNGKSWIVDMFDPGRDLLEGDVYTVFPAAKVWIIGEAEE